MSVFGLFDLPDDVGFWGNIFGGLIGVVGAFLVALWVSRKTRRQDQERAIQDEKKKDREKEEAKIVTYHRTISFAESGLQPYLIEMYANARRLRGCVEAIKVQGFMANLPRTISAEKLNMQNFQNLELMNKWLQYSITLRQVDNLIDDFRSLYVRTTESVRKLQLQVPTGNKLEEHMNANIIREDYLMLAEFGEKVIEANERLIEATHEMLALITHHAKRASGDNKFNTIAAINDYRVSLEVYEQELAEIKQRFESSDVFDSLGSNLNK